VKIDMITQLCDIEAMYLRDATSRSIYAFHVNDVPVLQAIVDNQDPDLAIYVRRWGSDEEIKTNGRARTALHELPPSDGTEVPDGLSDHIDGMTVYTYVVPRLLRFVTQLYVNQV
jgi:hypothetical protein